MGERGPWWRRWRYRRREVCAVCGAGQCPIAVPPPDGPRFCSVGHMERFIQAIGSDDETVLRCDRTWGPGNWVTCLHDAGIVRHHRDLFLGGPSAQGCPRAVPAPALEAPEAVQPRQAEPH